MTVWEEIKAKLSIEDVISNYITLSSKGGGNYGAKCPFHNEKTASLIVSSDKQIWHCFGCGLGGDVFSFVNLIENITLQESLVKLAGLAGVELKDKHSTKSPVKRDENGLSQTDKKYLMLEWVANLYHQNLLKELQNADSKVTKYLTERGLDIATIKKFKLGLAPSSHILNQIVKDSPEKQEILKSLSLIL